MGKKVQQSVNTRLKNMVKSNPKSIKISESEIAVPTDTQARISRLIQTHAGSSILPNNGHTGIGWIDSHVDGSPLTYLGVSASMTSGTGMRIQVDFSHDGTNYFGSLTTPVYDGTAITSVTSQDVQLPARYFRINITNKDATNPKVTNAYAYLKA